MLEIVLPLRSRVLFEAYTCTALVSRNLARVLLPRNGALASVLRLLSSFLVKCRCLESNCLLSLFKDIQSSSGSTVQSSSVARKSLFLQNTRGGRPELQWRVLSASCALRRVLESSWRFGMLFEWFGSVLGVVLECWSGLGVFSVGRALMRPAFSGAFWVGGSGGGGWGGISMLAISRGPKHASPNKYPKNSM